MAFTTDKNAFRIGIIISIMIFNLLISFTSALAISYQDMEDTNLEVTQTEYELSNLEEEQTEPSIFEYIYEFFVSIPSILRIAAQPNTILGGNVFLGALPFFNIAYSFTFPYPLSIFILIYTALSTAILVIFSIMIILSFIPTISG